MAATPRKLMLRGAMALFRELERQADVVAEVLQPGPLGLQTTKQPRDVQQFAAQLVQDAKRRGRDSVRDDNVR